VPAIAVTVAMASSSDINPIDGFIRMIADRIQALLTWAGYLSVQLADQHRLTEVNAYPRRTDLNLEWHDTLPSQRMDRLLRIAPSRFAVDEYPWSPA
jgi:hypothetical protein